MRLRVLQSAHVNWRGLTHVRKTWLLFAIGVAVLLALLPRAAHGAYAQSQSNSQTYPDSIGENANAPDITSTVVSNAFPSYDILQLQLEKLHV